MTSVPITTDHIRATLADYLDRYPGDKAALAPALELLESGADMTTRAELRGHATASAVLRNPQGDVLLVEHRALKRWIQPGGHLEPVDRDLRSAALRELSEEAGINPAAVAFAGTDPIHIDCHPIPDSPAKSEPAHLHLDFRYLFTTDVDFGTLQTEEVTAAAWRPVSDLADPRLRERCAGWAVSRA